ncbi:unnamed protein product [Arabidopsis thaliana]|uniref:RNase H type-1 domain-containing protein n=1 Tax=Arabidopsis thaliana TaxID=3702 RepID=A0A5S9XIJ4_ARATH|nr:unnamed protein product [Arabidopsis thaliana]
MIFYKSFTKNARNALLFSTSSFTEKEIVDKAQAEAKCWQSAQDRTLSQVAPSVNSREHLISSSSAPIVCYTDAAWNAISFNAGLGWSFRSNTTPSESTITRAVTHRSVVSSAIEAEALAILPALTQARSLGFSFIPSSANCEADLLAKHALCAFESNSVP